MAVSRWSRFGIETLRWYLGMARRQLAAKEDMMRRHRPGTVYHTYAKREADTHHAHILEIEQELRRRMNRKAELDNMLGVMYEWCSIPLAVDMLLDSEVSKTALDALIGLDARQAEWYLQLSQAVGRLAARASDSQSHENQDERMAQMKRVGGTLDRQLCIELAKSLKYVDGQASGSVLKASIKDSQMLQVWLSAGAVRQIDLLVKEVERIERDSIILTARARREQL